jgi:hypothetical protein
MKSSDTLPLEQEVEEDEFFVGGFDENERGPSLESKQLVVLAVEKVVDKKATVLSGVHMPS